MLEDQRAVADQMLDVVRFAQRSPRSAPPASDRPQRATLTDAQATLTIQNRQRLARLKGSAIIDAEVVCPGDDGIVDFEALHSRTRGSRMPPLRGRFGSGHDARIALGPVGAGHREQADTGRADVDLQLEPSCLISCSQPRPSGGLLALVSRHGSMNESGARGERTRGLCERHNMPVI